MTIAISLDHACKVCAKPIVGRRSSLQTTCVRCALSAGYAKDKADRQIRREVKVKEANAKRAEAEQTRARRVALKSRRDWLEDAQKAFNAWVRARDAVLPCVSCGRHHEGQYHAGHYLTVGARPELRFDPLNVHKQCSACNTHLHGNLILYRVELVRRIGQEAVDKLEGPHPPAKWSVDELQAIRDGYRLMTKQLLEKQ